jgi:hypothetical protein
MIGCLKGPSSIIAMKLLEHLDSARMCFGKTLCVILDAVNCQDARLVDMSNARGSSVKAIAVCAAS